MRKTSVLQRKLEVIVVSIAGDKTMQAPFRWPWRPWGAFMLKGAPQLYRGPCCVFSNTHKVHFMCLGGGDGASQFDSPPLPSVESYLRLKWMVQDGCPSFKVLETRSSPCPCIWNEYIDFINSASLIPKSDIQHISKTCHSQSTEMTLRKFQVLTTGSNMGTDSPHFDKPSPGL